MHAKIMELAEMRAREISGGALSLDQLGESDRDSCWLVAEDEYIYLAERQTERDEDRADHFWLENRGEDI